MTTVVEGDADRSDRARHRFRARRLPGRTLGCDGRGARSHRHHAAPEVARARDRVRRRHALPPAVRVPARATRPRPRCGATARARKCCRPASATSRSAALEPVGTYAVQPVSPTATTPASTPGTTSTTSARSRSELWNDVSREARAGGRAGKRMSEAKTALRLPAGRRGREGGARAAACSTGRRALRPDERPHVARPAPRLEALRHRASRGRAGRARARRRRRQRRPRARASRGASAPRGEVWLTDINAAMLRAGRDRLLDAGVARAGGACDAEKLPFPDGYVRLRQRRLRPAQHDAQGRARSPRWRACSSPAAALLVLEFSKVVGAARRAPTTGIRSRCCRGRRAGRGRRRELPLPRRIDPHASRPGDAEGDDGDGRLRAGRSTSTSPRAWSRCIAASAFDSMDGGGKPLCVSGYLGYAWCSQARASSQRMPTPSGSAAAARSARSAT